MPSLLRQYILFICLFSIVIQLNGQEKVNNKNPKRPNIIFILTDDQRWDALGVMGNSILKTPNLDKIANQGVLFKNAYVTTSICCVSRASILSGKYEYSHRIHHAKCRPLSSSLDGHSSVPLASIYSAFSNLSTAVIASFKLAAVSSVTASSLTFFIAQKQRYRTSL